MSVIVVSLLSQVTKPNVLKISTKIIRAYASTKKLPMQVTVCGAGGRVGQVVSLMLKQSKIVDRLILHDIGQVGGIAVELNHVDSRCNVVAQSGDQQLGAAMEKSNVVVVVASAPKIASEAYATMFHANAKIIKDTAESFAKSCPNAILIIATNPINSLVPLASEILRTHNVFNPKKVFGVTSLNVVRANTFAATVQRLKPEEVSVPVIGGHADLTIVPLLSKTRPYANFTSEQLEKITKKIQTAHHDVIKLRTENECAYLSCAFAIARFVLSVVKGLIGENNIVECAYVRSRAHSHSKYLATPLLLGKDGIEKNYGIPGGISDYEGCQLQRAVSLIMKDVRKGEKYAGYEEIQPCDPCSPDPNSPPCPPNWCEVI